MAAIILQVHSPILSDWFLQNEAIARELFLNDFFEGEDYLLEDVELTLYEYCTQLAMEVSDVLDEALDFELIEHIRDAENVANLLLFLLDVCDKDESALTQFLQENQDVINEQSSARFYSAFVPDGCPTQVARVVFENGTAKMFYFDPAEDEIDEDTLLEINPRFYKDIDTNTPQVIDQILALVNNEGSKD